VPSQSAWMNNGVNGYASYAVSNSVTSHLAYGLGVYSLFKDAAVVETSGITVPNVAGVLVTDAMTWFIGGMGSITHIVNNVGGAVSSSNKTSFLTSYGSAGSGCTAAPSAPSGLAATAVSSGQINLSWTASTAGSGCSITYNVFRSTTSGFTPSSGNQIASGVASTSFSNTGLAGSTTYFYLVEGADSAGSSGPSNQASATTPCSAPTSPTGLTATAASSSQINLSWAASSSSCAVTYNVFRSTTNGFTPSSSNQIASGVTATSYSDSGLSASTTYYYLVEGTNSGGTSGASNQASATTSSGGGGGGGTCTSICIDSGSTTAVSPFVADADFSGGATINHANTINTSNVTNPAPQAVYQSARVTTTAGSGSFTYTIPGLTAGTNYLVRLHFAETFWTTAGSRKFNVSINGTQVLTNFDIFAAAGGQNIANVQEFTMPANSSGQLVITFTSVTDKALISGIEIDTTTTTPPPPTCTSLCIDSGSTTAVGSFVADADFSGGATINHANTINTSNVTNPAPAAVYQTARVTATAGAGTAFSYTIGGFTAGSSHTVRLHFCETFHTTAGSRQFNVSINGTQVLTNFDIFATAGGQNIANIQEFTETANASGQYVITFTTVIDKALISGIEID
jgi:Malectin domain/Fibronectin type III domain